MSRKPWVVFMIAVACIGVGLIVGGIVLVTTPPDPCGGEAMGAICGLGEAYERAFGWGLIAIGALFLLGLLLPVLLAWMLPAPKERPGGAVDEAPAPLPEARVHARPPDSRT